MVMFAASRGGLRRQMSSVKSTASATSSCFRLQALVLALVLGGSGPTTPLPAASSLRREMRESTASIESGGGAEDMARWLSRVGGEARKVRAESKMRESRREA